MRQKRTKAYKKLMDMYQRHFGFRPPFQVLYTGDFIDECLAHKMDPIAGVTRTLVQTASSCKGLISQCCIKTLYDGKDEAAIGTAKKLERRRCGHIERAEEADACVLECVGSRNKNRYVVATQDRALRAQLRDIPGVPLIYLNRSVLVMEPPSPATTVVKEQRENAARGITSEEKSLIKGTKRRRADDGAEAGGVDDGEKRASDIGNNGGDPPKKRKRKGPPGPNPLSVKKKKAAPPQKKSEAAVAKPVESAPSKSDRGDDVVAAAALTETTARSRRKRRHRKTSTATPAHNATPGNDHDSG
ncbi:hypothetical protein PYCC9005_000628 [Savitreella phatthalungensis]